MVVKICTGWCSGVAARQSYMIVVKNRCQ